MSSNNNKSRRNRPSKLSRPNRGRGGRSNASSIAQALPIYLNPDRVFMIQRSLADVVLFYTAGGFQAVLPPSYAGISPWVFNAPAADSGPALYTPTYFGFAQQCSLKSLGQYSDIVALFSEYQIRQMSVSVMPLMADNYNGSIGSPLVGLQAVVDPVDPTPPNIPSTVEAFSNIKTQQLSQSRPFTMTYQPFAIKSYAGLSGEEQGISSNNRSDWISTASSYDLPFYGLKGVFRNFPSTVGSGCCIRMTGSLTLALRRIH